MLLALVITLLRERHTRQAAEVTASQRMSELAHINRHATAGEMSAAIAHELNQPLGAILNNAETAAILLESDSPDVTELKAILSDIRRDDERAGEIIKRLRALVSKKIVDFQHVDLNHVSREALGVAEIQAHSGGITLHSILAPNDLPVVGDAIQLQQVILNLAMNAIEATDERKEGPRDIVVRTTLAENLAVEFSISDFVQESRPIRTSTCLIHSSRPKAMGWGWDYRSRAQLSRLTTASCGPRTERREEQSSDFACH